MKNKYVKLHPRFIKIEADSSSEYYFDPEEEQMYSTFGALPGYARKLAKESPYSPYNYTGETAWTISDGKRPGGKSRRIRVTVEDIKKRYQSSLPSPSGSLFEDDDTIELGQILYTFDKVYYSYIVEGMLKSTHKGSVPVEHIPEDKYYIRKIGSNEKTKLYYLTELKSRFYKEV